MTSQPRDDETASADDEVLTTPATPGAEALPSTDPDELDESSDGD